MLRNVLSVLKSYLLIQPEQLRALDSDTWKMSVVRLVLFSGFILTFAILAHSSYRAYSLNLPHVLVLTGLFTLILWGGLSIGRRRVGLATGLLTGAIVLAGISILLFTRDLNSTHYGLLFFFSLPVILRIFYGSKVAVAGMLLNTIPFIILLRNEPITPLFGFDITMPGTHIYLSALVFLFFNFCLPLAVMRVLASLERQAQVNCTQSQQLGKVVKQYQEIFNNGGTPSFFCDQEGKILRANRSGNALIQEAEKHTGKRCHSMLQLFKLDTFLADWQETEASLQHDKQSIYRIQRASLEHHKRQLVHCFDVSESAATGKLLRQLQRQHMRKYYSDELTELKNHNYWSEQFEEQGAQNRIAVMLKLDTLKDINLQHGFARGDELLADVAAMLGSQLPSAVHLYRYPGAKFLIILDNRMCPCDDIQLWLERYLPMSLVQRRDQQRIVVRLDWRAGYVPMNRFASATLVSEACALALSQTSASNPYQQYNPKLVKLIRDDSQRKAYVRQLLDAGGLQVWLQPQVNQKQALIGYEVLARLHDSKAGVTLQPKHFLPIIEKHNWHVVFSHRVLDATLALLERWPATLEPVPLSINLSGPELLDDLFYEKLLRRFSESKVLQKRLKLELTETSVVSSQHETKKRLTSLANAGAVIIVDDFGTGHASLSQLIDLSAAVLKVDRDFVEKIETSGRHRKIVQMTLQLANSLHMDALAEGVERESQFDILREMGFTQFQGFYFGRPTPLEKMVLAKSSSAARRIGRASAN